MPNRTNTVVLLNETGTLIPEQVPTSLGLLKAADTYQQVGVKYPQRATFHSYAELLHGALLEGDSHVSHYVPQPFRLRVGRRIYIPDCYVVRAGRRIVCELKPRGEFDESLRQAVTAFLANQGIQFDLVANEAVLSREQEARNWLHIVRSLVVAKLLDTTQDEQAVLDQLDRREGTALSALLDPSDRPRWLRRELAIYRLLHRGDITSATLAERPLGFTTEVRRCN